MGGTGDGVGGTGDGVGDTGDGVGGTDVSVSFVKSVTVVGFGVPLSFSTNLVSKSRIRSWKGFGESRASEGSGGRGGSGQEGG